MRSRNSPPRGFTIVELLIVIVVIGILAAIVIVAYNGLTVKAQNSQRFSEIKTWQKMFESYKALYSSLPTSPDYTGYCLGTSFPVGFDGVARCRDYMQDYGSSYKESDSVAFMNEMKKVATIPKASAIPIKTAGNSYVGPFTVFVPADSSVNRPAQYELYALIQGTSDDCIKGGMESSYYGYGSMYMCKVVVTQS